MGLIGNIIKLWIFIIKSMSYFIKNIYFMINLEHVICYSHHWHLGREESYHIWDNKEQRCL